MNTIENKGDEPQSIQCTAIFSKAVRKAVHSKFMSTLGLSLCIGACFMIPVGVVLITISVKKDDPVGIAFGVSSILAPFLLECFCLSAATCFFLGRSCLDNKPGPQPARFTSSGLFQNI